MLIEIEIKPRGSKTFVQYLPVWLVTLKNGHVIFIVLNSVKPLNQMPTIL